MTVNISDSVASILGWLMANEKESIWKEMVMASLWYNASIYLEWMGKMLSLRVTDEWPSGTELSTSQMQM